MMKLRFDCLIVLTLVSQFAHSILTTGIQSKVVTTAQVQVRSAEYDSWQKFKVKGRIMCAIQCYKDDAQTAKYYFDVRDCCCLPYPVFDPITPASSTTSVRVMHTTCRSTALKIIPYTNEAGQDRAPPLCKS